MIAVITVNTVHQQSQRKDSVLFFVVLCIWVFYKKYAILAKNIFQMIAVITVNPVRQQSQRKDSVWVFIQNTQY